MIIMLTVIGVIILVVLIKFLLPLVVGGFVGIFEFFEDVLDAIGKIFSPMIEKISTCFDGMNKIVKYILIILIYLFFLLLPTIIIYL